MAGGVLNIDSARSGVRVTGFCRSINKSNRAVHLTRSQVYERPRRPRSEPKQWQPGQAPVQHVAQDAPGATLARLGIPEDYHDSPILSLLAASVAKPRASPHGLTSLGRAITLIVLPSFQVQLGLNREQLPYQLPEQGTMAMRSATIIIVVLTGGIIPTLGNSCHTLRDDINPAESW
jgi:hypothetical protein